MAGRVKFSIINCLELDFVGVRLQSLFHWGTQISFIVVSGSWLSAMREGRCTSYVQPPCSDSTLGVMWAYWLGKAGGLEGKQLCHFSIILDGCWAGHLKTAEKLMYNQELMGFLSLMWLWDRHRTDCLFTAVLRKRLIVWVEFLCVFADSVIMFTLNFLWVLLSERERRRECLSLSVCVHVFNTRVQV